MRNTAKEIVTAILVAGLAMGPAAAGTEAGAAAVGSGDQQQSTNSPSPTQQEAPPAAPGSMIRSTSDLVRIDVQVTDKSGKLIKGLTPEQFSITEDGKQQKVSIFSFQDIEKLETVKNEDAKPIVVAIDSPKTAAA